MALIESLTRRGIGLAAIVQSSQAIVGMKDKASAVEKKVGKCKPKDKEGIRNALQDSQRLCDRVKAAYLEMERGVRMVTQALDGKSEADEESDDDGDGEAEEEDGKELRAETEETATVKVCPCT